MPRRVPSRKTPEDESPNNSEDEMNDNLDPPIYNDSDSNDDSKSDDMDDGLNMTDDDEKYGGESDTFDGGEESDGNTSENDGDTNNLNSDHEVEIPRATESNDESDMDMKEPEAPPPKRKRGRPKRAERATRAKPNSKAKYGRESDTFDGGQESDGNTSEHNGDTNNRNSDHEVEIPRATESNNESDSEMKEPEKPPKRKRGRPKRGEAAKGKANTKRTVSDRLVKQLDDFEMSQPPKQHVRMTIGRSVETKIRHVWTSGWIADVNHDSREVLFKWQSDPEKRKTSTKWVKFKRIEAKTRRERVAELSEAMENMTL